MSTGVKWHLLAKEIKIYTIILFTFNRSDVEICSCKWPILSVQNMPFYLVSCRKDSIHRNTAKLARNVVKQLKEAVPIQTRGAGISHIKNYIYVLRGIVQWIKNQVIRSKVMHPVESDMRWSF